MSRSPEALRAEVSRLSLAGRARLLENLVASLETDEELEAAWEAVADEREADFDTGRAHPVGCADAVTRLEARFPGPRSRCIQIDPMRLSPADRQAIVRATAKVAGADTRVLLFGSRTDDSLRGGDIDLLVECAQPVQRPAWLAAHIGRRTWAQGLGATSPDGQQVAGRRGAATALDTVKPFAQRMDGGLCHGLAGLA